MTHAKIPGQLPSLKTIKIFNMYLKEPFHELIVFLKKFRHVDSHVSIILKHSLRFVTEVQGSFSDLYQRAYEFYKKEKRIVP